MKINFGLIETRKEVLKNLSYIILFFYLIGFFIHNSFMSQFSIIQLELFRGRYLYSGITSSIIILAIYSYMSLSVSFDNAKENFNLDFFLEWLGRIEIIPFVFFYLFEGASNMFKKELLFFERFFAAFTFFMAVFLFYLTIFRYFIPSISKDNDPYDKFYSKLTKIISLPVLFMIILFSIYNSIFRSIAFFVLTFVICFWSWLIGINEAESGHITNYTKSKFHEWLLLIVICFIGVAIILSLYSRTIYGKIAQSYGGGKPTEAVLVIGQKSEEVKIFDETENWIIYEDSKGKIIKINHAQVTLIKFNK